MDQNPNPSDLPSPSQKQQGRVPTAIIVTTAMLTFISFWRAAAVVLCDLASSAYYVGGIAEKSIGKAAPWFVLGVMLFANLVRIVYIESCAMFVRGGVFKTVRQALGATMAKLAVSALMFDYILTGPISSVSAGHYLAGFANSILEWANIPLHIPGNQGSMLFAVLITLYFWRKNIMGIEESSDKSLKIMQWTGVMVIMIIVWSLITIFIQGAKLPPFKPQLTDHALGWFQDIPWVRTIGLFGVLIGFGHSILAMSGEESLAQVYRDIESPKLKNLIRAGIVISVFSIMFTALSTFFAVMIIPDDVRVTEYGKNLIVGLSQYLVGPHPIKLLFQAFVVIMGAVILGGAVNTAIVGSNGEMNRVTEDGILPRWFKGVHKKYGTTHRIINMIVGIQIVAILLSGGDVFLLGEAYAFGVIWSFVFITLSVTVLRFKDKSPREWRVPGNFKFGSVEIPVGLIVITSMLILIAIANFFTKTVATKTGVAFTVFLFIVFFVVDKVNRRKKKKEESTEQFNLKHQENLEGPALKLEHKDRFIVAVRDPNNLSHLIKRLEQMTDEADIIVLRSRRRRAIIPETDQPELTPEENELFSNVVTVAEKYGRDVIPMIVPSNDPLYAIAKTAVDTRATEIILGSSNKFAADIQLEKLAMAWGTVHPLSLIHI